MNIINNIKLNYSLKTLNQCIENKDFTDFEKNFNQLKKLNEKIAKKYLKYNCHDFIENSELDFLFNNNTVWVNSFIKKDTLPINNIISKILESSSKTSGTECFDFYTKVLSILDEDETNEFTNLNDIFLKSHYYFQLLINLKNPGIKIVNTSSAFFEYNKSIYFTHQKLTKCFYYVIKHPYQIFQDLKNEGKESGEAIRLICNLDNRVNIIELEKNGTRISCPENRKSWSVNVSSWTNQNVESSLRGLIIKYDDLFTRTEDLFFDIAGSMKEAGLLLDIKPLEISSLASSFNETKIDYSDIQISNKEKKIIDRECGETIEKFFSNDQI